MFDLQNQARSVDAPNGADRIAADASPGELPNQITPQAAISIVMASAEPVKRKVRILEARRRRARRTGGGY